MEPRSFDRLRSVATALGCTQVGVQCKTSEFAILELAELKKVDVFFRDSLSSHIPMKVLLRKHRDDRKLGKPQLNEVREFVGGLTQKFSGLEIVHIDASWSRSLAEVAFNSDISPLDTLHLWAAMACKVDYLLTNDQAFVRSAQSCIGGLSLSHRIRVCLPTTLEEFLAGDGVVQTESGARDVLLMTGLGKLFGEAIPERVRAFLRGGDCIDVATPHDRA